MTAARLRELVQALLTAWDSPGGMQPVEKAVEALRKELDG